MTDSPANPSSPALASAPAPTVLRLDPAPSRVYSWIEWRAESPAVVDELSGRLLQPSGPALLLRYRSTGLEQAFWPVSLDEARAVMNPGARYGYSVGSAVDQVVKKAGKSSRQVRMGERQATREQRAQEEQRTGRRWLA